MDYLNKSILQTEQEIHKRNMEKWAYNYPFTAAVMFGNREIDEKEIIQLIDLGEKRRALQNT